MQVHNSPFATVIGCARTLYRTEGLGAFYVSYPTTLLMTIPFTAVQFSVYEHTLKVVNPTRVYDPLWHITAGGLAGAVAAAVTTPLDVAKTLLQTRGTSNDKEIRMARGIRDAVHIIWRRDGLKGFARGLTPRVLTFIPSNALCWMSYEFFSKFYQSLFAGSKPRSFKNRNGFAITRRTAHTSDHTFLMLLSAIPVTFLHSSATVYAPSPLLFRKIFGLYRLVFHLLLHFLYIFSQAQSRIYNIEYCFGLEGYIINPIRTPIKNVQENAFNASTLAANKRPECPWIPHYIPVASSAFKMR